MANKLDMAKFEMFWTAYPKKRSKGDAKKAFAKINPDKQLLAIMLVKIEEAGRSREWRQDNGQFIPHPATWLNDEGWENVYVPAGTSQVDWLRQTAKAARAKWEREWKSKD